jgi:hypothetical protein
MNYVDDWNSTAAFDDIEKPMEQKSQNTFQCGLYRPIDSSIYHGKGYCSIHLYLVNTATGEAAELYFNNVVKVKGGFYSVKRKSEFAKLYIECFGGVDPRRFSKANQLMKHFVNQPCLLFCKTQYATRANGEVFNKVIEQRNGNSMATEWKLNGNLVETDWKPQTAENPINTKPREQSQVIDKYLIENSEIEQYEEPMSIPNKNEYMTANSMGGYTFNHMPDETKEKLYQRAINETF